MHSDGALYSRKETPTGLKWVAGPVPAPKGLAPIQGLAYRVRTKQPFKDGRMSRRDSASTVPGLEWLAGFEGDNTKSTLNKIAHSFKVMTPLRCIPGSSLLGAPRRARLKEGRRTSSGAAMTPTQGLPGAGRSTVRARPQWSRCSRLGSDIALAYTASRRGERGFYDMKGAALNAKFLQL